MTSPSERKCAPASPRSVWTYGAAVESHPRLTLVRARTGSWLGFAGEQQRNGRDRQNDADDRKGVAETHDERLAPDGVADRYDRLVLRRNRIGHAVGEEIVRQLGEALPDLVAIERYRLADDVRVKLLPLGQHGCERCGADGTAEIAQHVGKTGGGGGLGRADGRRGDAAQGRQYQRLADGAHDIRHQELVTRRIRRQREIHEAAPGEERNPERADIARVEALHEKRQQRNDE